MYADQFTFKGRFSNEWIKILLENWKIPEIQDSEWALPHPLYSNWKISQFLMMSMNGIDIAGTQASEQKKKKRKKNK